MKADWYQKAFSYLYDIPIEKIHSEYSGTLEVSLHRGEWKLATFNAIYSFGKHYTSFSRAFKQLGVQQLPAHNILILGVGLGSVVRLLKNHPTIKEITAVDIDPVIIQLAQKYWPDTDGEFRTSFYAEDAIKWLKTHPEEKKYDLILSDIFIDDQTPENMLTNQFLNLLKDRLSAKGLLIYSKLQFTEEHKKANYLFDKTFSGVFPSGFTLHAQYNKMYIHRQ